MGFRYYYNQLIAEIKYIPTNVKAKITKKKIAIYVGAISQNNLGDEAVFEAIQHYLTEKLFIYPFSYSKVSSGKYLRNFLKITPSYIITGGGTIIKKGKDESYLKILLSTKYKYPKAKTLILGAGVADPILAKNIGFPTDNVSWKKFLDKADYIGVRGKISKKILKDIWKVNSDVDIIYDPAIFFKKNSPKKKKRQKVIAVNFCNILGRIYGQDQKAIEIFANSIIEKLLEDNFKIFLYPTAESDIPYMKSILSDNILSQIEVYENYSNLSDSLNFLESMDLLLGMRLHSIIFSSITYTPFLAIEYESKTSDYLNSANILNNSIRTDELSLEEVFNHLKDIYYNLDQEQNNLFEKINNNYNSQKLSFENISKKI